MSNFSTHLAVLCGIVLILSIAIYPMEIALAQTIIYVGEEVAVSIRSGSSSLTTDAYSPNPVYIRTSDTVTWTNNDSTPHTVTSGTAGTPDGKFDSSPNFNPLMAPQQTFSHTFTEAGEFPYYCGLHPNMVGTVIVSGVVITTLTVDTDDSSYTAGDNIGIYGRLNPANRDQPIKLEVIDPEGNRDRIDQVTVGTDGYFRYSFTAGGLMNTNGYYTVIATYRSIEARTSFYYAVQDASAIRISVYTDRYSYSTGDTIRIFGTLDASRVEQPVLIVVYDPEGNRDWIDQVYVGAAGSFSMFFDAGGLMNTDGTYTVTATFGDVTAYTYFSFDAATTIYENPVYIVGGASSRTTDAYSPSPIYIDPGDTITWINNDSTPHTVTSGTAGTPDGKFDSSPNFNPLMAPQQTFSHTFTAPGEFPYYCGLHPNMVGTVVVSGYSSSTSETWYPGEGVKVGMYVKYRIHELDTNDDQPYEMTLYFREQQAGDWIVPTFVVDDDGRVIEGTMKLSDSMAYLAGGSNVPREMNDFIGGYSGSLHWLDSFTTKADPKSLATGTNWGRAGSIGGSDLVVSGQERIRVSAGTFDTTLLTYHKGVTSRIWILDDFPFPIKAQFFTDSATGKPQVQFEFELLETGTGRPKTPTGQQWIPESPLSSTTGRGDYRITLDWGPAPIESGTPVIFSIGLADRSGFALKRANYDLVIRDSNGSVFGEFRNQNADPNFGTGSHRITFEHAGRFTATVTINSVNGQSPGQFTESAQFTLVVGAGQGNGRNGDNGYTLNVSTDRSSYSHGETVNITIDISGNDVSGQNVAVSVTGPTGIGVVSRAVTTDDDGSASISFRISADSPSGTYRVISTMSAGGARLEAEARFAVKAESPAISIISVQATDQQGNAVSAFTRGALGFVKVVVSSESQSTALVTVNIFDSDFVSMGVGSLKTSLGTGTSEMVLSFFIPSNAATGQAEIYANVFTDWPASGGVPLTGESLVRVNIR